MGGKITTDFQIFGTTRKCRNAVKEVHYFVRLNNKVITSIIANLYIEDYIVDNWFST